MRRKAQKPTLRRLAQQVAQALLLRGGRVALAESCTGGGIAKVLTDIPGSSAWFERGLVTYSNAAKQELLGVPAALLERHGAVSRECALAMAAGLRARAPVDWTIAVTGIAGPGGGTAAKPVGLVWLAVASRRRVAAIECRLRGTRSQIRNAAAAAALQALLERIDGRARPG